MSVSSSIVDVRGVSTRSMFASAVAFEWTKLRTLRSTFWNLFAYFAVSVGFALIWGLDTRFQTEGLEDVSPIDRGYNGFRTGMLVLIVFGVLAVTSEYTKQAMTSTLLAVPKRRIFYGAKLFVGTTVALVASVVVIPLSFFTTQIAMGEPLAVSLLDENVARSLIGAVLFATLFCTFCMGVATILRSSVLSISLILAWYLMISTLLGSFSKTRRISQFAPDQAGSLASVSEVSAESDLTAWSGLAVLLAWVVLSSVLGFWAVHHRDVS